MLSSHLSVGQEVREKSGEVLSGMCLQCNSIEEGVATTAGKKYLLGGAPVLGEKTGGDKAKADSQRRPLRKKNVLTGGCYSEKTLRDILERLQGKALHLEESWF